MENDVSTPSRDLAALTQQRQNALERLNNKDKVKSTTHKRELTATETKVREKYMKQKQQATSEQSPIKAPSPAQLRVERVLGLNKVPKLPLGMLNKMPTNTGKAMMSRWSSNSDRTPVKGFSATSTPREGGNKFQNPRRQGKLMRQRLKYIALQRAQTAVKGKLESRAAADMVKACELSLHQLAAEMIQRTWQQHKENKRKAKKSADKTQVKLHFGGFC